MAARGSVLERIRTFSSKHGIGLGGSMEYKLNRGNVVLVLKLLDKKQSLNTQRRLFPQHCYHVNAT